MNKANKRFKINFEKIIQMIILLFLFNYIYTLIIRNNLSMYLHPRMNWMIIASLYIISIFMFFPMAKISSERSIRFHFLKYLMFTILLSIFYLSPKGVIQSDIANLRGVNIGNNLDVYNNTLNSSSQNSSDTNSNKNNSIDANSIPTNIDLTIDSLNFINAVDAIYLNQDDFKDKVISITGIVAKSSKLEKNQFEIIYFGSDSSVYGILCSGNEQDILKLKNKDQIELIGTIYSIWSKFSTKKKLPVIKMLKYKIISSETTNDADNEKTDNITITIDESNFIETIDAMFNNQDAFDNKNIKISGFIFHAKDFSREQFVIGRMAIFCCAADASVYGLLCTSDDQEILNLKDKQWVEVEGTIFYETTKFSNGEKIPSIKVSKYKTIQAPKDEYVYYHQY